MDFMDLVRQRQSVRKYDSRPVDRQYINECLEAARLAPSACNSEPWQFIVVQEAQTRKKLCKAMLSGIYSMNDFINDAPVLVVVVTDKAKWFAKVCNVIRDTKMYLIDIGIACEHFVLRAAELGIGTCWLGWFNEKQVKKVLGIHRFKRVDVIIAMGYPAPTCRPSNKERKGLSDISRYV